MTPTSGAPCAPRPTGGLAVAASPCLPRPVAPPIILSDAILRPRIIAMDGFGAGPVQSIGVTVDPATVAPDEPFFASDPLNTIAATGITATYAVGRYPLNSGGETTVAPLGHIGLPLVSQRWRFQPTGGRGGGGLLLSVADTSFAPFLNGHWEGVLFPTDARRDSGGAVIGLDLLGKTPPVNGLNLLGFLSAVSGRDNTTLQPKFTVACHVVLAITPSRTLVMKRFDLAEQPTADRPYGLGTWVPLAVSTQQVPATGRFTIEAGMFLSSFNAGTNQLAVPNGLVFARLHTAGGYGQTLLRALDIVTRTRPDTLHGVVWGTDVTDAYGDGAGTLTGGMAEIAFDSVVVYDNMGTVKRHLYDLRVGTSLPIGTGNSSQSTPHGGLTRWANVGRRLVALGDVQSAYNLYSLNQIDRFTIEAARAQAREILAVSAFKWGDQPPTGTIGGGNHGNLLVKSGAIEIAQPQVANGPILDLDDRLVLEQDPETSAPFLPAKIAALLLGWESTGASSVLFQLGLEYAYREAILRAIEAAPYAPRAAFGFVAVGDTGKIFDFLDISVDWDGAIASNAWDFGDGTTGANAGRSYAAQGPVRHTYTLPGIYSVSLTVTDDDGLTATVVKTVVVANTSPVADFTAAATDLSVDFTDGSSDPDGTVAARAWAFGDGATSAATNPSHTYAGAGTYLVTLTVTDNLGATTVATRSVTVPPAVVDSGAQVVMPHDLEDPCGEAGLPAEEALYGFVATTPILRAGVGQGGGDCVEEADDSSDWEFEYAVFRTVARIKRAFDLNGVTLPAWDIPLIQTFPAVVSLALTQTRHLRVYAQSATGVVTLLGTSTDPVPASGFTVAELGIKYSNTMDGFVWVRINNVQLPELKFTGINVHITATHQLETSAHGSGLAEWSSWSPPGYAGGVPGIRWDNAIDADPTGKGDDDYIGDVRL